MGITKVFALFITLKFDVSFLSRLLGTAGIDFPKKFCQLKFNVFILNFYPQTKDLDGVAT